MNSKNNFKTLMTIILTAIITFTVTYLWLYGKTKQVENAETTIGNALASDNLSTKLNLIKSKIEQQYIGKVDDEQMKEYAVKGYVAGLDDEYTEYFTKDEMESYTEETFAEYVGIGIYMYTDRQNDIIKVKEVMEGSPAEAAGMKDDDIIRKVGDEVITAEDDSTISSIIKGKAGTTVKIDVEREGKIITLDIVRNYVKVKNVKSQMMDNNIGYIYISSFEGDVSTQFKEEYDNLTKNNMKALILDLRNNGGGIANEAVEIGDFFTNKGETLLIQSDKNGKEVVSVSENDKEISMPTAVLTNKYSASASEILAGILKEKVDNATLIGNKTYGKGVIQTLFQLSDGSGLKLTTNKYYTPNRNDINKKGIEPDITTEEYTFKGKLDKDNDIQLKKAIETLQKK